MAVHVITATDRGHRPVSVLHTSCQQGNWITKGSLLFRQCCMRYIPTASFSS